MTHNLALIGYPIDASLAPHIYTQFLAKHAINGGYNAFSLPDQVELPVLLHFLERFGFTGLNISAPHKQAIIEHVQNVDDSVRKLGAANTLKLERDGWLAYNTETYGFAQLLDTHNMALDGEIIIMGAGSAASAVLSVLQERGIKHVSIANRSEEHVKQLKERSQIDISYFKYQSLREQLAFDIVINCSSADWAHPLWLSHFWGEDGTIFGGHSPHTAIDLQYHNDDSGFLARWESPRKVNGLAMLAAQAAKAFEIWFGVLPEYELSELIKEWKQ
ncbi:MAG: hypothetical protein LBV04_06505 [Deferribacteraceae bacterium]|jgi:shikimate dehydrogenase|nr:hypothetical protein [Deferribacteraceae bacterium]